MNKTQLRIKKRYIILLVIAVIVVAVNIFAPEYIGNMYHECTDSHTGYNNISFDGEKGDRLKIILTSEIENGDLDIVLYDSSGNEVYRLDHAKKLKTFCTLESTDTYTMKSKYNDFVGKYKVKVYREK
ncbi:MAG: hypothetical protein NC177_07010 [Ruminococcus flavefaciens]|nr:hypothetical protein [Ruminococcus flavefaciens]